MKKKTAREIAIMWNKREVILEQRIFALLQDLPLLDDVDLELRIGTLLE